MATFKALLLSKTEAGQDSRVRRLRRGRPDGRRRHGPRHALHRQLQGRARHHRKGPVVRRWPMIPGIDAAGVVENSSHPDFTAGDAVVLNGWGTGETHLGAYAQKSGGEGRLARAAPRRHERRRSHGDRHRGLHGDAVPAGAGEARADAGGGPGRGDGRGRGRRLGRRRAARQGGLACHRLHRRASEADYLRGLGAAEIIDRAELSGPGKPLAKERWAAGVDSVGSHTLANLLAMTKANGAIAACGLAQGMDLPSSVAPFILRGVSLLGIDSVMCPKPRRLEAWARLARDLDREKLAAMTTTIGFDRLIPTAEAILKGEVRGRASWSRSADQRAVVSPRSACGACRSRRPDGRG